MKIEVRCGKLDDAGYEVSKIAPHEIVQFSLLFF